MSKGMKITVLFLLMIMSATFSNVAQQANYRALSAFFGFAMLGLIVAIIVVAFSRAGSRRR